MLIAQLTGGLARQLQSYLFARTAAARLNTTLKLDLTSVRGATVLTAFRFDSEAASASEIAAAKRHGTVLESSLLYDAGVWNQISDGCYLSGDWADLRYGQDILPVLLRELDVRSELAQDTRALLSAISQAANAVSLDLRPLPLLEGQAALGAPYFEDALAEMRDRYADAHFYVLCEDAEAARSLLGPGHDFTLIAPASKLPEVDALLMLSACRHHIVGDTRDSLMAARLDPKDGGHVIVPAQLWDVRSAALLERYGRIAQPVYPDAWQIFPTRLVPPQQIPKSIHEFAGAKSKRPIRIGWYSVYERFTTDNYLFKNIQATNGHNLLKPFVDLYEYGQANGIEFMTLDLAPNMESLDAIVFSDKVKLDNPLVQAALNAKHLVKILVIYECPLIKPDNYDPNYHALFDYVFTWADDLVDGKRYIKNNFVCDFLPTYDVDVLKTTWEQRKLACLVNSCVMLQNPEQFPTQLYTHRLRTIKWFETSAPQDFDLYGMGWDKGMFPSYRGKLRDKLAALAHYKFKICYENAMGYPGYITEKIQDCLIAGTVPVYGGTHNVSQWIPSDCYIDIAQFQNYDQLHRYLSEMDQETHSGYLERIRQFLESDKAYPFKTECWVNTLTHYLAWEVQSRRGEVPELAQQRGLEASARTHQLVQNKQTLALEIVPRQAASLPAPPPLPTPTNVDPAQAVRAEMAALERDDLIVAIPWGPELAVYSRARALWEFYASHFPKLKIIFFSESDDYPRGVTIEQGSELIIGNAPDKGSNRRDRFFDANGTPHAEVSERVIYRQMALYDYLLRKYDHNFRLLLTTITSVIDFRGLLAVLDALPAKGLFGGVLGTLQHPPYQGVGMVHGANTFFSRDVMELMRSRYEPGSEHTKQPNDHWQGVVLRDVARIGVPLFSFNAARATGAPLDDVGRLVENLVRDGHFHFRIKTKQEAGMGERADIDTWMMLKAMETILKTPYSPDKARSLQLRFHQACDPTSQVQRDFPIDDSETQYFYR